MIDNQIVHSKPFYTYSKQILEFTPRSLLLSEIFSNTLNSILNMVSLESLHTSDYL